MNYKKVHIVNTKDVILKATHVGMCGSDSSTWDGTNEWWDSVGTYESREYKITYCPECVEAYGDSEHFDRVHILSQEPGAVRVGCGRHSGSVNYNYVGTWKNGVGMRKTAYYCPECVEHFINKDPKDEPSKPNYVHVSPNRSDKILCTGKERNGERFNYYSTWDTGEPRSDYCPICVVVAEAIKGETDLLKKTIRQLEDKIFSARKALL